MTVRKSGSFWSASLVQTYRTDSCWSGRRPRTKTDSSSGPGRAVSRPAGRAATSSSVAVRFTCGSSVEMVRRGCRQKVPPSPCRARPAPSLDYPRGDRMKQWLETREVLDFLAGARRAGQPAALATVVRVRGSAYRHEGSKLAVAGDGSSAGNVSGGCLEQDVREVALQVIRSGAPELRSYCSSADEIAAWDLGVGCEGQVDVYVERAEARPRERALLDERRPFVACGVMPGKGERLIVTSDGPEGDLGSKDLNARVATKARELLEAGESGIHEIGGRSIFFDVLVPPPQLVVLGAGDDARPLVRFAADVGFRVVVVDRRPGYLTRNPTSAANRTS